MKPKTKLQKQVVELSSKLPALTDKQREWAVGHCFEQKGYLRKKTLWCTECGHTWGISEEILVTQICGVECPYCGKHLKVETSRKQKDDTKEYISIITTCGDFQVLRHFVASRYCRVGYPAYYSINEAVNNWITPGGKDVVLARLAKQSIYYNDLWDWSSPMTVKVDRNVYYNASNFTKYNIFANFIYPVRKYMPVLKRNGFAGHFHNINPLTLFKSLLTDTRAETLIKAGQYSMLQHAIKHGCSRWWPSVRICIRNRYLIKDASMWTDYLTMLSSLGKDIRNAKYICPANLKKAHDLEHKKVNDLEALKEIERKRADTKKHEEEYLKLKARFFDVEFSDDVIQVSVLRSVQEFLEEGAKMHHCVYSAEYYLKKDSLILSAHIGENRIETVEVSLKTMDVVQSRGVCNKNTEYHDRIVGLVKQNMRLIRKKLTA